MPPPSQPPGAPTCPRALAIDRAWRALGPGVEPLSGPGGAPLTRTVKLIVLPLVIRPSLHTALAADVLGAPEAALLDALIRRAGPRLAATAGWFTLLKRTRRALGVVAGNPQDLYFQRCFELATGHGPPADGADALARAVLAEVADAAGGRTVEALKAHLADPALRARLDGELAAAWEARRPPVTPEPGTEPEPGTGRGRGTAPGADPEADSEKDPVAGLAAAFLDACAGPPAARGRGGGGKGDEGDDAFAALVDGRYGSAVGRALWTTAGGRWGRDDLPPHLGLTAYEIPPRPRVGRGASTATLPAPLDRTLLERLFTVLQTSAQRAQLPPVPRLVEREVARSCAPFGLSDEGLRVAAVLGGHLAAGIDPLGEAPAAPPLTAAHRVVNRRWQREASVLRARRMTTAPDPDGGALATIAEELHTPWSAYMRRLWVRLHGRDVREDGLGDDGTPPVWELLDGVARSVMMDHRAKVRAALRALTALPAERVPDGAGTREAPARGVSPSPRAGAVGVDSPPWRG